MIIACPACATRYVVPDSAIGIEGRTVRCAKCKHSWFQDGPDADRLGSSGYSCAVTRTVRSAAGAAQGFAAPHQRSGLYRSRSGGSR